MQKLAGFFAISVLFLCVGSLPATAKETASPAKVILDTDFHHFADDHEALLMLNTLRCRKTVDILGVSLVVGNHWMAQIKEDAVKAVERLGLGDTVPVYVGASAPLVHNYDLFALDKEMYGSIYAGAWTKDPGTVVEPLGGYAQDTTVESTHAIDFIIRSIRANPGEVTILALGPLTNIAMALRKDPGLAPLIKEIIYMGGNIEVLGNVTAAAEFNFWFDAESAAIVLGSEIKHTLIPLDATDKLLFNKEKFERMVGSHSEHLVSQMFFLPKFQKTFAENPDYVIPVWDALVPALLTEDKTLVRKQRQFNVMVDHNRGPNYGRVLAYPLADALGATTAVGTKPANVILEYNAEPFWAIYEDLIFDPINDSSRQCTTE